MVCPGRRNQRFRLALLGLLTVCVLLLYYHRCVHVAYSLHLTQVDTDVGRTAPCQVDAKQDVTKCEVIEVAVVCAGEATTRDVSTLVKSILFYRRNPIRLHVVADKQAADTLTLLFNTWKLPAVQLHLYPAASALHHVDWIPNKHYSGVYGLLKLALTQLLPETLDKNLSYLEVIVVDTDVVFVSGIESLWAEFANFETGQMIGLVENQSPWYLGNLYKTQIVWPALGRGFNTGLMLMDLSGLRRLGYMRLWTRVTKKYLPSLTATALADQDIVNTVLTQQPSLLHRLPCQWNVQLGDRSIMQQLCVVEPHELRAVHWNSPSKTRVHSRFAELLRRHQQTFVEMDGGLFRTQTIGCNRTQHLASESDYDDYDEDNCYEFRHAASVVYRTHVRFTKSGYNSSGPDDVTLVTQLSFDRIQLLDQISRVWSGPMSVAVYLSDAEAHRMLDVMTLPANVALHVVYRDGPFYPINHLRNTALNQALTPYVFLTDIDFMPPPHLYQYLIRQISDQSSMERKALVVPAFETRSYRLDELPNSKSELINQLDTAQIHTFRTQVWPQGHAPTDYDKWRASDAPYSVGYRAEYEPYVVVSRDVPRYDTRFVGFGWNKVSHIMQLDAFGYDFIVLPDAFIIHMPHAPSLEIGNYRTNAHYRKCLRLIKEDFIKDLTKQRRRARVVPIEATPVVVQ